MLACCPISEQAVPELSIKSKTADYYMRRRLKLSNKNVAISAVILVSIITFVALLGETYVALQGINPAAALAAVAVVLVGILWFRKAAKS